MAYGGRGSHLPCRSDSRHYARNRGGLDNGSSYLTPGLPGKMNDLFNMEKQKPRTCLGTHSPLPLLPLFLPLYLKDFSLSTMKHTLPSTLQRLNFLGVWIHLTAQRHWEMIPSCHLLQGEVHTVYPSLLNSLLHPWPWIMVSSDPLVTLLSAAQAPAFPPAWGAFVCPSLLKISTSESP